MIPGADTDTPWPRRAPDAAAGARGAQQPRRRVQLRARRPHGGDDVVEASPRVLVYKPRGQWHTFWSARPKSRRGSSRSSPRPASSSSSPSSRCSRPAARPTPRPSASCALATRWTWHRAGPLHAFQHMGPRRRVAPYSRAVPVPDPVRAMLAHLSPPPAPARRRAPRERVRVPRRGRARDGSGAGLVAAPRPTGRRAPSSSAATGSRWRCSCARPSGQPCWRASSARSGRQGRHLGHVRRRPDGRAAWEGRRRRRPCATAGLTSEGVRRQAPGAREAQNILRERHRLAADLGVVHAVLGRDAPVERPVMKFASAL